MFQITLSLRVVRKLLEHDPSIERDGGFQGLTIKLQRQLDPATNVLTVSGEDLDRIERYRTRYGQGGWQDLFDEVMGRAEA